MRALMIVPMLLAGCVAQFSDPNGTGVEITPEPGFIEGPRTPIIRNRTGEPVICYVMPRESCDDDLEPELNEILIEDGEEFSFGSVECIAADFECEEVGTPADELPLRVWTWTIF